jgi:type IV pilus assembly protein PilQ
MRKNGNVILIAPRDELATREKLEYEARQQIGDLEPLRTETFQINYHKAETIFTALKDKSQTILSKRGQVVMDSRSNKLFITDIPSRLDDIRRMLTEIDIPSRQVLIEARIVEASDAFAKNLGVRLGALTPSVGGNRPTHNNNLAFAWERSPRQLGTIDSRETTTWRSPVAMRKRLRKRLG